MRELEQRGPLLSRDLEDRSVGEKRDHRWWGPRMVGLMLLSLHALRRDRRRRPAGRRAAVGPRVALVARDEDGLRARRRSGSGPSAGSGRRASDSSGASGRRTPMRRTDRCRTGPSSSRPSTGSSTTATGRRRSGTSATGSRCSCRRRSASTGTTCCRSSSATRSSAVPSRASTGRRARSSYSARGATHPAWMRPSTTSPPGWAPLASAG